MNKILIFTLSILFASNGAWVWYLHHIHKEKNELVQMNALIGAMNETLRQKQTLLESAAKDPELFKSFERAMTDMTAMVRQITPYKLVNYRSQPGKESIFSFVEVKTSRRFDVVFRPDAPPTNLFRIPSTRK